MLLYDDLQTISIVHLVKEGYLTPGTETDLTIALTEPPGEVRLHINTILPQQHLRFTCTFNEQIFDYVINLVSLPSHLNSSLLWYFICPFTGARCRKLYFADGYFLPRTAINGTYYKKTLGTKVRSTVTRASKISAISKMLEKVNAPYFRKTYVHKPTESYKRITKELMHA